MRTKTKCLAIEMYQPRGVHSTLSNLVNLGLRDFDFALGYCGAALAGEKWRAALDPQFIWEHPEPQDWLVELKATIPAPAWRFFLDCQENPDYEDSHRQVQLWISGWIQSVYRLRAIDAILSTKVWEEFDWIFLVRPDYLFTSPIQVPESKSGPDLVSMRGDSYGGLNDRFLAFRPSRLRDLRSAIDFRCFRDTEYMSSTVDFFTDGVPKNPETLLKHQLRKSGLDQNLAFVGQMGFCVREPEETSRWSMGYWSSSRNLYIKYPTELLLAKWTKVSIFVRSLLRLSRPHSRLAGSSRILAISVRVAGTQPRLFLAPLLVISGELRLGATVFLDSKRDSDFLVFQLLLDFGRLVRRVTSTALNLVRRNSRGSL